MRLKPMLEDTGYFKKGATVFVFVFGFGFIFYLILATCIFICFNTETFPLVQWVHIPYLVVLKCEDR